MDETPDTSHGPNGQDQAAADALLELRTLETNILLARAAFARQVGMTYDGARDMWAVMGYKPLLSALDFRTRYTRGGIAGRLVDALPNATWRGAMELIEDESKEDYTEFEQAWHDFDQRLQVQAKLLRADKLAGLSTYATLLIGERSGSGLETPLPKGKSHEDVIYLTPFFGGGGPGGQRDQTLATDTDCTILEFDTDYRSKRFGLPLLYSLKRVDVASPAFMKPVHWTRIIHIAEGVLDNEVYGQPTLERVWNLLDDLDKVTGGGAEAFWLRANQGLHLNIDKDLQLSKDDFNTVMEKLKEQSELYRHQLTRWLKTRGTDVQTLGSDVANFANPADAIMTQIAGAKGVPKRILTGSEMGELASSQDRDNWKDQINGRQTGYAGPYIVRPLVDRLIAYGYLPTPRKGADAYEVRWPHIQTLTEQEKATGAQQWASTNATQGEPVFTDAEIRDKWYGMAPLTDEQREEIAERKAEAVKQAQELMQAQQPKAEKEEDDEETFPRAAMAALSAEEEETLRILEDAIAAGNEDVVLQIIGLKDAGTP